MALSSTGPINHYGVQLHFGGSNPIGLSEYYNADPYKPVPAAGEISLNDFRGSSAHTCRIETGESDDYVPRRGYSAANGSFYYTQESGKDKGSFGSISKTQGVLYGGSQLSAFIIQRPTADIGVQMVVCHWGDNEDAFGVMYIKAVGGGTYDGTEWVFYGGDSSYASLSNTSPQAYGHKWQDGLQNDLEDIYDHMNDNRPVVLKFLEGGRNR